MPGRLPELQSKIIGEVNSSQDEQIHDISGISKCHSADHNNSPKIAIPVLAPDRTEKRQNGRRFKENGEPMFTLTAQDGHGVGVGVRYTKDGFHLYRNDKKKSSIQGTHVTYPEGNANCLNTNHVPMVMERFDINTDSCSAGEILGIIDDQGRTDKKVMPKDTCPTLRCESHGNEPEVILKGKETTKQGYAEVCEGDSINLSMPESKTRRGRVGHQIAQTLDTSCNQGTPTILKGDEPNFTDGNNGIYVEIPEGFMVYAIWYEKERCYIAIRRLTPKECFRLQGWTDDYFEKAAFVNSDSQLYKQAGNGVTVNVVYEIGRRIAETEARGGDTD